MRSPTPPPTARAAHVHRPGGRHGGPPEPLAGGEETITRRPVTRPRPPSTCWPTTAIRMATRCRSSRFRRPRRVGEDHARPRQHAGLPGDQRLRRLRRIHLHDQRRQGRHGDRRGARLRGSLKRAPRRQAESAGDDSPVDVAVDVAATEDDRRAVRRPRRRRRAARPAAPRRRPRRAGACRRNTRGPPPAISSSETSTTRARRARSSPARPATGTRTAIPSASVSAVAVSTRVRVRNDCAYASAAVGDDADDLVVRPSASRAAISPQMPDPQPIGT